MTKAGADHVRPRSAVSTKIRESLHRRRLLELLQESEMLGRLQAADLCRSNTYAPAWTSVDHPAGGRMEIMLNEEVCRQIYIHGAYEEELSLFLVETVKPGETFVDAGAHFGYFSILASNLVGAAGTVLAFEPHPENYAMLRRNLKEAPNAKAEQLALWSCTDEINFNAAEETFSAFSSFTDLRLPAGVKPVIRNIKVHAVSLDEYCSANRISPNFLKIDVESAEMHVIRGAKAVLETHKPILSVEVGDYDNIVAAGGTPRSADTLRYLSDLGYTPFHLVNGTLCPHVIKDHYSFDNIICIHGGAFS